MHKPSGFTLVELTTALAVTGILASIALPALTDASEAARSSAARGELVSAWMRGATHSTGTGNEVVLCPGDAAGCRDTVEWRQGWIAFADLDGNRSRSPNEPLLHASEALGGKVNLRSTAGRTRVIFQPDGSNAGSNITWTLCDGRGAVHASTIVVANDGRLRAGSPTAAAALACMAAT